LANFLGEVKSEIKKVKWPTKKEVWDNTLVVFVIVVVFTAIIAFMDIVLVKIVSVL